MADDHDGHAAVAEALAPKQSGSGDKIADGFDDHIVKPGAALGLDYLVYQMFGPLAATVGPGFIGGAAAENLAKNGNISIGPKKALEEMVTGTSMAGAGALALNKASTLPTIGLGGAINAFGQSISGGALAALGAAALVGPLIYYPVSHVVSTGKLEGLFTDLRKNYLRGLRTIPISLLGAAAAYAGIFAMAPYIAPAAALYLMSGYRTALSRENWGYMKAVGMSFAAPVAAAGALGYYLTTGIPKAAFQLGYNILRKGYSLALNVYGGATDLFDSFGKIAKKPIGTPIVRASRPAPAAAAGGGGGGHH